MVFPDVSVSDRLLDRVFRGVAAEARDAEERDRMAGGEAIVLDPGDQLCAAAACRTFAILGHIRFFGVLPANRGGVLLRCDAVSARSIASCGKNDCAVDCRPAGVGYYLLIRFVPIPGAGMPGRDVPFMDEYNNLTAYSYIHPAASMLQRWRTCTRATCTMKYRDPEGWLSTLPSIGTSLLGILAGNADSLRTAGYKDSQSAAGLRRVAGIALGYAWNVFFPFNKNMWTSSYVLLAAGIASLFC